MVIKETDAWDESSGLTMGTTPTETDQTDLTSDGDQSHGTSSAARPKPKTKAA